MSAIAPINTPTPIEPASSLAKVAPVAEPVHAAKAAPEAQAFVSPIVRIDAQTGLALTIIRDNSDGNTIAQYPSKQAVQEYDRAAKTAAPPTSGEGTSAKG